MLTTVNVRGQPRQLVSLLVLFVIACSADAIVNVPPDSHSRTVFAAVGQEVRVTLGNAGVAEYESPPRISSAVVTYIGVDVVPPYTPAGPNQQFRFKAENRGEAIIRFRRLFGDSVVFVVEDTIEVR